MHTLAIFNFGDDGWLIAAAVLLLALIALMGYLIMDMSRRGR